MGGSRSRGGGRERRVSSTLAIRDLQFEIAAMPHSHFPV